MHNQDRRNEEIGVASISDTLSALPALVGHRYTNDTALALTWPVLASPVPADAPAKRRAVSMTLGEITDTGAPERITGVLNGITAGGISRVTTVLTVLMATYPVALPTVQPGMIVLPTVSRTISDLGLFEVPVLLDFSGEDGLRWAHLSELDPDVPVQEQPSPIWHPVPDWTQSDEAMELAVNGGTIAASPERVGAQWTAAGEFGKDRGDDSALRLPGALADLVTLVEGIAHPGHTRDDRPEPEVVAAGLSAGLADDPVLGFLLAPSVTSHPQAALTVLGTLVPHTRGLGRSLLLDWAAAAAVLAGDHRNAVAALRATLAEDLAAGPTEITAALMRAMTKGTEATAVDLVIDAGLAELAEHPRTEYLVEVIARSATRAGHPEAH